MIVFRACTAGDHGACLSLFDANCPDFFAPNERVDYIDFLETSSDYSLCLDDERIVGAYGLEPHGDGLALRWIMIAPTVQGRGLGSSIMARVRDRARDRGISTIHIAASHKSAPFFGRAGARAIRTIDDGWGPGMHRVDMILEV